MIYIILMDVKNLKRLLTQIKKRNKKQTLFLATINHTYIDIFKEQISPQRTIFDNDFTK